MRILSVDVGTTAMKMAVFDSIENELTLLQHYSMAYTIHTYNDGLFSDIDPQKWQEAFSAGCQALSELMADVDVVSFSGTTPGMTAMDADGNALYPAILMLDQRSRKQAQYIIDAIGIDSLLQFTANMPVAGGCSLASILWIKDHHPEIFHQTHTFGHSNTFMVKWLTGGFAMDPSSASLTALYNTTANDMSWNAEIAQTFGLDLQKLPELMPAFASPGRIKPEIATAAGLAKEPPVLIGGNDAVLAAYSVGINEPGEIFNINGTCEISMVCLAHCHPSQNYNIRTHVMPERWLSFFVMNAQGKAFEWFKTVFCSEMSDDHFFNNFMPEAIDTWLMQESGVRYAPYLMGSRYTLEPLKAAFTGITQETSRAELLAAMVRGLCTYQRENLKENALRLPLSDTIIVSGGAVNDALLRAKRKWMHDCTYQFEEESSLRGAAMLGLKYLQEHT